MKREIPEIISPIPIDPDTSQAIVEMMSSMGAPRANVCDKKLVTRTELDELLNDER